MRYTILVTVLFLTTLVHAQVPGFMGKRWAIFLEANPTPALFVMNSNNEVIVNPGGDDARTDKVNRFAFNFRPTATVEYMIGRNSSLGVSYGRISVGTVKGTLDETQTYREFRDDLDVLKGQSFGLHFKTYGSNSNAPIGFYQTYSVYVTQTNTYDTKKSSAKQFKNNFVYPVASYSLGRQTMVFKNFVLKTGVEFGWAFVPANFLMEGPEDWNEQDYAGYNAHQSLFGYYLFNFNIAIGYLPF